jgi:hypothetical protein
MLGLHLLVTLSHMLKLFLCIKRWSFWAVVRLRGMKSFAHTRASAIAVAGRLLEVMNELFIYHMFLISSEAADSLACLRLW